MIYLCQCGFAPGDPGWFDSHQDQCRHRVERPRDVSRLTAGELERARRELAASLALARPGSPARVPILAHMSAIDAELDQRAAATPGELPGFPLP